MLSNYLNIAWRNLAKNKVYSFINLFGLAIGMACCLIICLWIADELSYDRFHANGQHLYKVLRNSTQPDGSMETGISTSYPIGNAMAAQLPEVKEMVQITYEDEMMLATANKSFKEKGITATPNLFGVFSFPLLLGNPHSVLQGVHSVVISESLAKKIFGKTEVLNRTLDIVTPGKEYGKQPYQITGVFRDLPTHSSLQFQLVVPLKAFIGRNTYPDSWNNSFLTTFVQLRENVAMNGLQKKMNRLTEGKFGNLRQTLLLQPFGDT